MFNSNDESQHGAWCILYLSLRSIHATAQHWLQVSVFHFHVHNKRQHNKDEFVTEKEKVEYFRLNTEEEEGKKQNNRKTVEKSTL